MKALSPRERRLLAVAILIALLATVFGGVAIPVYAGFQARAQERARLHETYARQARAIAALDELTRRAGAQKSEAGRYSIVADSTSGAAEQLKGMLADGVSAVGGELSAVQEADAPTGWTRASVDARLTYPQLLGLLERLQNTSPYLVVDALSVNADPGLRSGPSDLMEVRVEASALHSLAR